MVPQRQRSDDAGRRRRPRQASWPGTLAGEDALEFALRLAESAGNLRSLAVTLVHRGRRRLEAGDATGGADWGIALALAVSVEPTLAQRVVATTARWARERCLAGAEDSLLAAALATLIESAGTTAARLTLGEPEQATLAVVLNAFRVIGAICAYHDGPAAEEAAAYATAARTGAAEVDELTAGAFALAELVSRRL